MNAEQTIARLLSALAAIEAMSLSGSKANGATAKLLLGMMADVAREAINNANGAA